MTDWKSSLRSNPIPWLLDTACAPIRFRVLTELLDRGRDDPDVQLARQEMLEYPPALKIQRSQRPDGTWKGQIHGGDPRKFESSVENELTHLFELAWNRDTKPVKVAAKLLRTFLTQKRDLKFFEFAKVVKADKVSERYYRWFLRILALGLLIRAGQLHQPARVEEALVEISPVQQALPEEAGE